MIVSRKLQALYIHIEQIICGNMGQISRKAKVEHLLDGVSACTELVAIILLYLSERESQIHCMHSLYTSFNGCKYYTIFVFNEVDIRIYLPKNEIHEAARPR